MIILVFITAVLVSIILERQERRHHFELLMEYKRLGITAPDTRPKLTLIQSWLNIVVGGIISLMGAIIIIINLMIIHDAGGNVNTIYRPASVTLEWSSVVLAAGIALVIMGIKSVKLNREFNSAINKKQHLL